jgi:hypothetical protein
VISFFEHSTQHSFQISKEQTAEFVRLLNKMKAGPGHRAQEMMNDRTQPNKAPTQHVVKEGEGKE